MSRSRQGFPSGSYLSQQFLGIHMNDVKSLTIMVTSVNGCPALGTSTPATVWSHGAQHFESIQELPDSWMSSEQRMMQKRAVFAALRPQAHSAYLSRFSGSRDRVKQSSKESSCRSDSDLMELLRQDGTSAAQFGAIFDQHFNQRGMRSFRDTIRKLYRSSPIGLCLVWSKLYGFLASGGEGCCRPFVKCGFWPKRL